MTELEAHKVEGLCMKFYSKRGLAHAQKVKEYTAMESFYSFLSPEKQLVVDMVALGHDLLEDTSCPKDELPQEIVSHIEILTQRKGEEYIDYIKRILDSKDSIAIFVKMADIKDHLSRTATLTDKLKRKYKPAVELFLDTFGFLS